MNITGTVWGGNYVRVTIDTACTVTTLDWGDGIVFHDQGLSSPDSPLTGWWHAYVNGNYTATFTVDVSGNSYSDTWDFEISQDDTVDVHRISVSAHVGASYNLEGNSTGTSSIVGAEECSGDLAGVSTGAGSADGAEEKSVDLAGASTGTSSVAVVESRSVDFAGATTGRSALAYLRKNLVTNPNAVNDITLWDGWAGVGGAATITRIVDVSGPVANTAARMTWTTDTDYASGGIFQGATTASSPVSAGQTVTLSGYVRCSVSQRLGVLLVPYDASGAQLPSVPGDHTALVAANTWTRLSDIFVLPALSAHLGFGIYTWSWG